MMPDFNRRHFLTTLAALPLAVKANNKVSTSIIDTHIHLFDRRRAQGVPWPPKNDPVPGVSSLPPRYKTLVKPYGIVGAIVEEASPWLEDNQWVLDQIESEPMFVGTVGFLDPGKQDFGKNLERFRKNRLYLGIRHRDIEGRNIAESIKNPTFISDLKLLADAGLTFDLTAAPHIMLRVADQVPSLRFIIPHLPGQLPEERAARTTYTANLREFAGRPQVYMKLSGILKRVNGRVIRDLSIYQPWLDQLWDIFGEDRIVFGSDWPNSDHVGPFKTVLQVALDYVNSKGSIAAEKILWRNSVDVYRWIRRDESQPKA